MKVIYVNSSQLTYTLNENLTHFTSYNIELYVCREWLKDEGNIKDPNPVTNNCSTQKVMTTALTSKKGNYIMYTICCIYIYLLMLILY